MLWGQRNRGKDVALDAFPEMKLHKSCKIKYNPNISPDDPHVKEMWVFLRRLFENPKPEEGRPKTAIMDKILEVMASVFDGEPDEKKVNVFKGDGDNGKTRFQMLIKHAFGDYYVVVANNFFMGNGTDPSNATPHLAKIKGARFVALSEPKEGQIADGSMVKMLASPEDIDFRRLFGESSTFLITMRFAFFTNHFTPQDVGGFQGNGRFRFFKMPNKFTKAAPPDPVDQWAEGHFKPDLNLGSYLHTFGEPFLATLVMRYAGGRESDLPELDAMYKEFLEKIGRAHV